MITSSGIPGQLDVPFKRCPTCGRLTPADSNRCYECWNDVAEVPTLEAEEAARLRARQDREDAILAGARARRRQRLRWVRNIVAATVVILLGWWVYQTFVYEPPPVPLPSSNARNTTATAGAWAISGGDLGATRSSPLPSRVGATEAWAADLGSPVVEAPVFDGERLYAALEDGRLVALDPASGAVEWTHPLSNAPFAAPTVAGDRLYVAERQGRLLVLDTASGDTLFETTTARRSFATSPLVIDGMAYVFGIGEVYGFDAENGELLWRREVSGNWAFVTPVVEGRYIAAATGDRVLIFDRLSGQQTYFYEFERAQPYSIVLDDGTVYAASGRFAAALDIESRRPWWESYRKYWNQFWIWGFTGAPPLPPRIWTAGEPPEDGFPMAVGPARLYVAGEGGDLVAISREAGDEVWRAKTAAISGPPTLTSDGLVVVHEDGIALHDPSDGRVLREQRFEGRALQAVTVTGAGTFVAHEGGILALR